MHCQLSFLHQGLLSVTEGILLSLLQLCVFEAGEAKAFYVCFKPNMPFSLAAVKSV